MKMFFFFFPVHCIRCFQIIAWCKFEKHLFFLLLRSSHVLSGWSGHWNSVSQRGCIKTAIPGNSHAAFLQLPPWVKWFCRVWISYAGCQKVSMLSLCCLPLFQPMLTAGTTELVILRGMWILKGHVLSNTKKQWQSRQHSLESNKPELFTVSTKPSVTTC